MSICFELRSVVTSVVVSVVLFALVVYSCIVYSDGVSVVYGSNWVVTSVVA